MRSLRNKKDFDRVYKTGKSLKNTLARVVFVSNGLGETRIAVVTPKKLGRASTRNRIRRRIKEALKKICQGEDGRDIVVFPTIKAKNEEFTSLESGIARLLM